MASQSGREPSRYNFAARAATLECGAIGRLRLPRWLAFVAVAVGLGMTVGTHTLSPSEQASGETARAEQILTDAGFKTPAAESVIVRSETLNGR